MNLPQSPSAGDYRHGSPSTSGGGYGQSRPMSPPMQISLPKPIPARQIDPSPSHYYEGAGSRMERQSPRLSESYQYMPANDYNYPRRDMTPQRTPPPPSPPPRNASVPHSDRGHRGPTHPRVPRSSRGRARGRGRGAYPSPNRPWAHSERGGVQSRPSQRGRGGGQRAVESSRPKSPKRKPSAMERLGPKVTVSERLGPAPSSGRDRIASESKTSEPQPSTSKGTEEPSPKKARIERYFHLKHILTVEAHSPISAAQETPKAKAFNNDAEKNVSKE